MTDETRDDRGRLVSVVVDGQRFHRADDGQRPKITNEDRWKALRAHGPSLAELADTIIELRAERDSLRGVVQTLATLCDDADAMVRTSSDPDVAPLIEGYGDVSTVEIRHILAAAADAPQPEDGQR